MQELERQIAKVKEELMGLAELRPGSISQQYNVCGNPNCRCKVSPLQRHGPLLPAQLHPQGQGWHPLRQTGGSQAGQTSDRQIRAPARPGGPLDRPWHRAFIAGGPR